MRLTPVLHTAFGTVIAYYFLNTLSFPLITAVIVFFLFVTFFFSTLASLHGLLHNGETRRFKIISFSCVALAAGLVLGICAFNAGNGGVSFGIHEERVTAIEGVLLEDPRIISGGRAMAVLSLQRSAGEGGLRVSSKGEITVFFPEDNALKLREFGRGTTIFAEGKLRNTDTGYTFSANSLHITKPATAIERMRTGIRLSLLNRFDSLSEKTSSYSGGLSLALLLGIRDNLDTNLSAMYRNAGCSFILALSGMHLAVLAAIITLLLKKPLGLRASAITGALLICLYCFIVGPLPSLNRAALMYILGVIAIIGMLPREPMSILALSFLIQIVIYPSAGNSLSFILSYLSLAGILLIGQPLYSLLCGKVPDFLLRPLTASCGAFLATAGLTGFMFGIIAPVGIIAALVLVPLTTLYMIVSIIWLLLDFVSLSAFLSAPLSLLYRLMETVASFSGRVPGISAAHPSIILISTFFLAVTVVILEHRRSSAMLRLKPLRW